MLKGIIITLIYMLIGCGTTHKRKPINYTEELSKKTRLYVSLIQQDSDGFIMSDKCDSLLFTALLAATVPELNIDVTKARDENGHWHRRPAKDCGPENDTSRSSISRDMILGVMWWAWRIGNLKVLEELRDSLVIFTLPGTGDYVTRTLIPVYYQTLIDLIEALGGRESFPLIGGDSFSRQGGFVAHLNVLHILLRGEIEGEISSEHLELLKYHAEREPQNPLYVGAYAKYTGGDVSKMLNKMYPPRLPTTNDWCSPWVIERDYGNDWKPCRPYKIHSGADFLVIMGVLYY